VGLAAWATAGLEFSIALAQELALPAPKSLAHPRTGFAALNVPAVCWPASLGKIALDISLLNAGDGRRSGRGVHHLGEGLFHHAAQNAIHRLFFDLG